MYKVYEIKQRVFADNDLEADKVRTELKKDKTFLLNHICLFDYLFISSQMSAKPYFICKKYCFSLWALL